MSLLGSFAFALIATLMPQTNSFAFAPAASLARPSSSSLSVFEKGLLFDCDGVIIETESIHLLAYNEAWKRNGLVNPETKEDVFWSVEYYDVLQNKVGGGKNKMRYFFDETSGGVWPTVGSSAAPATDDEKTALVDKLQDMKTVIYQDMVKSEAEARPGLLNLLDQALNDPTCAVGVCSAATKSAVETVLSCALGDDRSSKLDVFLAGDDVSAKKPDPLIYTTACKRLGLDPSSCVVVEDLSQFGGINLTDLFDVDEICKGKKEAADGG